MAELSSSIKIQLIKLARRKHARVTVFNAERPTGWCPGQVRNPHGVLDTHFTDAAAWNLIADRLEQKHPVKTVQLDKPKGAAEHVMMIDLETDCPLLYVKLQLGSGEIIGRSFHYSEH